MWEGLPSPTRLFFYFPIFSFLWSLPAGLSEISVFQTHMSEERVILEVL